MKTFTDYPNINHLLWIITKDVHEILGDKLVGFYLMGSLTYDDFRPGRSDIDRRFIQFAVDQVAPR